MLEASTVQSEPGKMPVGLPVPTPVLTQDSPSTGDQRELFHQIPLGAWASPEKVITVQVLLLFSLSLCSHRETIYIIPITPGRKQ